MRSMSPKSKSLNILRIRISLIFGYTLGIHKLGILAGKVLKSIAGLALAALAALVLALAEAVEVLEFILITFKYLVL